ncbi:MAG: sulfotransferase [Myxococcales bacterium]|nr:MAG: sulfotransferase [Myxococcales bacterium]
MSQTEEVQVGQPHRPFGVKMINLFGRAANAFGMRPVALDEESLIQKAIKKAGSSDFGGDEFREGLRRFLASAQSEADLTLLGRLMVQGYVTDNLVNRLKLTDWRKQHPEIEKEEIVAPLFIVGLPRTGTTKLNGLIEQDQANRSPLSWEVQFPVPPATPETWDNDPRIAEDQKILDQLFQLVPGFAAMHPMGATMPQECVAVFTMCFMSVQLHVHFYVPS